MKEAASLSSKGRVKGDLERPLSIGSYGRSVEQARENIKEAIATVFIAISLNLLKIEDVKKLLDLAQTGSKRLSEEERERIVSLVQTLLERIVL